jgi:hypothetical protein
MATHTPLTKTVLTRNLTHQNYQSTRLHLTSFNESQIYNNSSFHEESEVHEQIPDRDRSILPRKFSTPYKRPSHAKNHSFNATGNTTGICQDLMNELEVTQESQTDHSHNFDSEDPFLGADQSVITKISHEPSFIDGVKDQLKKYIPEGILNLQTPYFEPSKADKFPSQKSVRSTQWHPQCLSLESNEHLQNYDNYLPGYTENTWCGKPRVALLMSNDSVEIHHTSDYSLNLDSENSLARVVLRHRLHEDLTSCVWKPFCLSTLAVISAKNGVLFWHKLGRHDMKSVATTQRVSQNGTQHENSQQKLIPSSNAQLVWSPPTWFKKPSNIPSVEKSCDISWTRNGSSLGIMWYGTMFLLKPNEFSELHGGFQSNTIARIDNICSPFSFNPTENTGLFLTAASQEQDNYIFDVARKNSVLADVWKRGWHAFNQRILACSHKEPIPGLKMEGGAWWETNNLKKRPDTIEGIYLAFYSNSSKVMQIQVNKSNIEDENTDEFNFSNKSAFDLNDNVTGNNSYFNVANPDDSLCLMRENSFVTSIVWKDDICLVAHGNMGLISVFKARVNSGGCAFQKIETMDNKWCSKVIDLTIFQNRNVVATFESGNFEYTRVKQF